MVCKVILEMANCIHVSLKLVLNTLAKLEFSSQVDRQNGIGPSDYDIMETGSGVIESSRISRNGMILILVGDRIEVKAQHTHVNH
jgi:hypothetical protein